MIEILDYKEYDFSAYQIYVEYNHGRYKISVYNDGDTFIDDYNVEERPELHEEYEQYLEMDLQLNKIYRGEEL